MLIILVTCADIEKKRDIRNTEYSLCLSRLFSYNFPVYGIISETSSLHSPFNKFPFTKTHFIPSTYSLGAKTKSQQEFLSIKNFCYSHDFPEDTWIIKLTGRYLLYNDDFVTAVKNADNTVDAVVQICNNNTQIRTFCYAIRWSLVKEYFNKPLEYLGYNCIETSIYSFLVEKKVKITNLSTLGIYADINNESTFLYF